MLNSLSRSPFWTCTLQKPTHSPSINSPPGFPRRLALGVSRDNPRERGNLSYWAVSVGQPLWTFSDWSPSRSESWPGTSFPSPPPPLGLAGESHIWLPALRLLSRRPRVAIFHMGERQSTKAGAPPWESPWLLYPRAVRAVDMHRAQFATNGTSTEVLKPGVQKTWPKSAQLAQRRTIPGAR